MLASRHPETEGTLPGGQSVGEETTFRATFEAIREQAVSTTGLEDKARLFASSQNLLDRRGGPYRLQRDLSQVEEILAQGYRYFRDASLVETRTTFAAEWMLDNYYLVQQAARQIREDMPRGYYRRLPMIRTRIFGDTPRVYALAMVFLQTCPAQVDPESLASFIRAYQEVASLNIGELWALPVMLRYGVLLCMTDAVIRVAQIQVDQKLRDILTTQVPCRWADESVVSMSILSLKAISTINWHLLIERVSQVDKALEHDPAGVYQGMDFATRNDYRKAIEDLAYQASRPEAEVAGEALQLAREALNSFGCEADKKAHVGYYLVDAGYELLEKRMGYKPSFAIRMGRFLFHHPAPFYLGGILLLTLLILWVAWMQVSPAFLPRSAGAFLNLVLLLLVGAIPASTVAIGLINWLVTWLVVPTVLPKMDFVGSDASGKAAPGIPDEHRAVVVIPCMLSNTEEVDDLLRQLELHYLGNDDPNLAFILLSDFTDAPQQNMPGEKALLAHAKGGIRALNRKYRRSRGSGPFLLFHRQRQWNPVEECWMGWERKRGKLAQFNHYLLNQTTESAIDSTVSNTATEDSFRIKVGNLQALQHVRYVITLDADTSLPRDCAARLVATLAHPLNRPCLDEKGQVVSGYSILQPRIQIRPEAASASLFGRIEAGNSGLDPYSTAVSDVYQDLFGEGSYVGKGIYDVAAFERSLEGRIPENALLSHDLFEGLHGRVGLVTDIILFEDYPSIYLVKASRRHRWARGDWQLLPWLRRRVPTAATTPSDPARRPNDLSLLDRWKIVDNLRRTLFPVALLLFFLAGWFILPGSPIFWSLAAVGAILTPVLVATLSGVIRLGKDKLEGIQGIGSAGIFQALLALIFLPYEASMMIDAVLTTLFRLWVSHKRLLQWTTTAHSINLFGKGRKLSLVWMRMGAEVLFAMIVTLLVTFFKLSVIWVAAPFLLAWLVSPLVAHFISQPTRRRALDLTAEQTSELRRLACRTWLFFEHFVTPDDNWLPPDHFQEEPRGTVVHQTSPTNIGLAFLSTLSAYDLGYIGPLSLSYRLDFGMASMKSLERYCGHFLNWYETTTLRPLPPRYVSTVDSGNLAGSLIALVQGLQDVEGKPLLRWEYWEGFLDFLGVFSELTQAAGLLSENLQQAKQREDAQRFVTKAEAIRLEILANKNSPEAWPGLATRLRAKDVVELGEAMVSLVDASPKRMNAAALSGLRTWLGRLNYHLDSLQKEITVLAPWMEVLRQVPEAPLETLRQICRTDVPTNQLPEMCRRAKAFLDNWRARTKESQEAAGWIDELYAKLDLGQKGVEELLLTMRSIAQDAFRLFKEMDFRFLFNRQRRVFHIGYNLATERLDDSYYDLLASEARLASYLAIAKGDVPLGHWLHLARPITRVDTPRKLYRNRVLLSWSGSMFEYLMPHLLMKRGKDSLIDHSCQAAVLCQMAYGLTSGAPWGISEAGFYRFDEQKNYQYRAFGVPGLGFKRGLGDDLVVAPYASVLAFSVAPEIPPQEVVRNLDRLVDLGALGLYGFYESIDFTRLRLPASEQYQVVCSYYAHHQGMVLLSLTNLLAGQAMVRRFHRDALVASNEILLHEYMPLRAPIEKPSPDIAPMEQPLHLPAHLEPWQPELGAALPQVQLLSNSKFTTFITHNGAGYSSWKGKALTRWRADTSRDAWGSWIYIQDLDANVTWSATAQPMGTAPENYQVQFYHYMASFQRQDVVVKKTPTESAVRITTRMKVAVMPDRDLEIRRLTLVNQSDTERRLRIASYGEMVLAPQPEDRRHPAFNKMFIESEYLPESYTILCRRRLRSSVDEPLYLAHAVSFRQEHGVEVAPIGSRAEFLGRNGNMDSPLALHKPLGEWSFNSSDLDPIYCLGIELTIPPRRSARVAFLTAAADSRSGVLEQLRDYQSSNGSNHGNGSSTWAAIDRGFNDAYSLTEQVSASLDLSADELAYGQRLLSLLMYPNRLLRAPAAILEANRLGQPGLWKFTISGDYPILLARIARAEDIHLVLDLLKAHAYWRSFNLQIDLVFLNLGDTGYNQDLHVLMLRTLDKVDAGAWLNQRGGIFLVRAESLSTQERVLLETTARVVLDGTKGPLAEQLKYIFHLRLPLPAFVPTLVLEENGSQPLEPAPLPKPTQWLFDNGFGGFSPDGREYWIYLRPGEHLPAPWINVIANPEFGFTISEAGSGYTWAANSGENRLTPWRNDPLLDLPGEGFYLRDEETGQVWSPTPLPVPAEEPYLVHHGAGYSIFTHNSHGFKHTLRTFAVKDAPVKVMQLRLENGSNRIRRVTVTYYAEWVLGPDRDLTQPYILSEFDTKNHAILARNPYQVEFGERVAFLTSTREPTGLTTDRAEFLGLLGDVRNPAALKRVGLTASIEAGADPCAALQTLLWIAPGETKEVTFLLGQGADRDETQRLVATYRDIGNLERAWQELNAFWDHLLGSVVVRTPDTAMDILLNRWLLYQALSCRLWGRTALYQSSGAYGFRDQLQDVLGLLHTAPQLARQHILEAASHQFEAGDVLHWWHPPSGRGVRTRCSDDLLWLPYVTAEYVRVVGDVDILSEPVNFLAGDPLGEDEAERYESYAPSTVQASLFEHCQRALAKGTTAGAHGLPLMGSYDWNDGMNRVGFQGRGESVWNAWFLCATLNRFTEVCELIEQKERAALYRMQARSLAQEIEKQAWDGEWYLRAFYDDGTPLGSQQDKVCQIDSLSQTWSVLSGAGDPDRSRKAMQAVYDRLMRPDERLVMLFTPPFDDLASQAGEASDQHDPGYIQGYPPGVRENGGQYTHAATWVGWAFAGLGDGERAEQVFRLLNPIYNSNTPSRVSTYHVEPYVAAADVYSGVQYLGRGGWTWYTGSAAWMYRLGLEAILGLQRRGDELSFHPAIPQAWKSYQVDYPYGCSLYHIEVENHSDGGQPREAVSVDGEIVTDGIIHLVDDGKTHQARIILKSAG